jgi:hypothetical protein
MKPKLETSSMVRISNKHIRIAKSIKRKSGIPVGRIFEVALEYFEIGEFEPNKSGVTALIINKSIK